MKNDGLKNQYKINDQITARQVRIVGDGIESKVVTLREALHIADEMDLDLVEISPNAQTPVCKIVDYSKFLYQIKMKQKEQKKKQVVTEVKEIRFGPQTDDHDYNFKLKHAIGFLQEGNKVKAYVFFKGRSIVFKEQGEDILGRFSADLDEYGKLDQKPLLEGKRMSIIISPKKSGSKKETAVESTQPAEEE
ncbi:MAG: translation initiation factor IF-3 [Bacteroidaceae bacterium]|nr:translation initiation factor IF-3 [Bacteroidaceae bacterium]